MPTSCADHPCLTARSSSRVGSAATDCDSGATPSTRGNRCRAGTSPTSGRSSPSRSPTPRRRCRATGASPGREFDRRADGVAAHAARRAAPASRTRSPSTSTTAPSTSSRCSARSRPAWSPVNTNYRYADDELVYLWDNADASPSSSTAPSPSTIERIRDRVPGVPTWLWVDDGTGAVPRRGPPPTRTPPPPTPSGSIAAVGPRRRRPAHALHRRHHRHAQGRDVAPGRPVPQPRRRR